MKNIGARIGWALAVLSCNSFAGEPRFPFEVGYAADPHTTKELLGRITDRAMQNFQWSLTQHSPNAPLIQESDIRRGLNVFRFQDGTDLYFPNYAFTLAIPPDQPLPEDLCQEIQTKGQPLNLLTQVQIPVVRLQTLETSCAQGTLSVTFNVTIGCTGGKILSTDVSYSLRAMHWVTKKGELFELAQTQNEGKTSWKWHKLEETDLDGEIPHLNLPIQIIF